MNKCKECGERIRNSHAVSHTWRHRLANGLVVKLSGPQFFQGYSLTSYPSVEMRDKAFADAQSQGIEAEILQVSMEAQLAR